MREVYADNAGTTKPSTVAINAMLSILLETYGNPSSVHHLGQAASEQLMKARE